MNDLSSGQITNLISNDATQVDAVFHFLHYIWVGSTRSAHLFEV